MNPTHPSLRFQAHLAFPQGLPSIQKCQKSLQARPAPTHGLSDSALKLRQIDKEIISTYKTLIVKA